MIPSSARMNQTSSPWSYDEDKILGIWLLFHVSLTIYRSHLYSENVPTIEWSIDASDLGKTCLLWISMSTRTSLLMCIHKVFIFAYAVPILKESIKNPSPPFERYSSVSVMCLLHRFLAAICVPKALAFTALMARKSNHVFLSPFNQLDLPTCCWSSWLNELFHDIFQIPGLYQQN